MKLFLLALFSMMVLAPAFAQDNTCGIETWTDAQGDFCYQMPDSDGYVCDPAAWNCAIYTSNDGCAVVCPDQPQATFDPAH